ncbi:MAG TPA: redox-regulated ATPase YchF [Bacteroidales bacterium]|jgi:GTP-binding protein YchF|nr:redox-regulated ATPase YchF [Bacteroidales bacterium]HNZ43621.1 redox-regulated ATPase YchF [Bacteroidales bacterium]HOH83692.1 redox-regulated ATPase YchF [Bacteroidales bacterium]HPB24139.1 redox-regulated ATPase YchF [Bacteroidales bacterium]HPI29547.1 redox-regulated ATPase YchF [Bacteroidales bacterium]
MGLNCGIVGLANSGKTTIFNCMSSTKAQITNFAFSSNKSNIAIVNVPDERLYVLEKLVKAAKVVHATVEIVDIPGLTKGSSKGEGMGNSFLADIRQTDAIIHVIRCFDDENLPHIEGSVNAVRDKEIIDLELQINDLEQVERKMQRTEKAAKTGDKEAKHLLEVLTKYKNHLESFQSARTLDIADEERRLVKDLCLLTEKPVLYVCNVDDGSAVGGNKYSEALTEAVKNENTEVLVIAGKLEAEISELETTEDRMAFLNDVGLTEPSVNKLIKSAFTLLNLRTFLTAGPKEVRAWTIKTGMNAQQAAGAIHSDLERGFIRAEVIKYHDFVKYGSENACKEAGKFNVEGKTYIVEEGDLMNIRFNV